MTWLTCRPHPAQVLLPQALQVTSRHMVGSPLCGQAVAADARQPRTAAVAALNKEN